MEKRRKRDSLFFIAVNHVAGVLMSVGAIGGFLYWLGATSFATNSEFLKFKEAIHEKADTMETTYIKSMAHIDKTQAIQKEQIKNITEDVREILRILRGGR